MNNAIAMTAEFQRQKNIKALTYTLLISGGILLLTIIFKMTLPPKEIPVEQDIVEITFPPDPPAEDVNLGNNDVGSGKTQPIVTGTPSTNPVSHDVAPTKSNNSTQATKDFTEDNHKDAPAITKPTVSNTSKEINNNANEGSKVNKPAPPSPRAVMTSTRGSGNGGNTDLPGMNRPGSQGPGDGPGDKGVHNGNPKATNFGVKMYPIGNQSFEDDFNQNAKVAMLVEVDANGKVTSATHTSKGSTGTATKNMIGIAQRRAFQVKFPATGAPQKGTLLFDFSVR